MATIDLIVLGMLKKESMDAYDIQKQAGYRQISKWVKIRTINLQKVHTNQSSHILIKPAIIGSKIYYSGFYFLLDKVQKK